jgi:Lrp/AsnC family leucine-responsive transcriptional regulator
MLNGVPDEIDLKIMQLLQLDARLEVVELARRVHLTRTPVANRVQKLKDRGYIKAYVTLLDREKIDQPVLVVVHVKLREQTREWLHRFEQAAMALSQVQSCLHVSGCWDFILQVTAVTPQSYYIFLMEEICSLPNVAHVESSLVLRESKSHGAFELACHQKAS